MGYFNFYSCRERVERRGGSEGTQYRPLRGGDYSEPWVRKTQAKSRVVKSSRQPDNYKITRFKSGLFYCCFNYSAAFIVLAYLS